jgi:hypothetical protein
LAFAVGSRSVEAGSDDMRTWRTRLLPKAYAALVLMASACVPKQPTNGAAEPAYARATPSATPALPPPSTAASPATAPPPPPVEVIALEPNSIAVDGQPLVREDGTPYASDRRRMALYTRLWPPSNMKDGPVVVRRPATDAVVRLTATDAVDGALFRDAYAAALGYRKVAVSFVPEAVRLDASASELDAKLARLAYLVRRDALEVWRITAKFAQTPTSGEKASPPLASVSKAFRFNVQPILLGPATRATPPSAASPSLLLSPGNPRGSGIEESRFSGQ